MTAATTHPDLSPSLRDLVHSIAPKRFLSDPLGLVSGYRAYLVYTYLSARSDDELAGLGLERSAISRVAMSTVLDNDR